MCGKPANESIHTDINNMGCRLKVEYEIDAGFLELN